MHKASYRIYYEDTDAGGVVYHTNYLKYAERARTDMLRDLKISQKQLWNEEDTGFVVRHLSMDLKKPAKLDDEILVASRITKLSKASMMFEQTLTCGDTELAIVHVRVACISSSNFKPKGIPERVAILLNSHK